MNSLPVPTPPSPAIGSMITVVRKSSAKEYIQAKAPFEAGSRGGPLSAAYGATSLLISVIPCSHRNCRNRIRLSVR